jgi:hypothetical protein
VLDRASAETVLRPTADAALRAWRTLVLADSEQVEALPNRPRPEDFYAPVAETFRADPKRRDDPVLEHLRSMASDDDTWLDLGAGGGRYALAIALHVKRLYAVEPSEGMRTVLLDSMREHAIANVDVFPERWPGPSSVPVADVAFMSHVGYDIADVGPFLEQFEEHSRRLCLVVPIRTRANLGFRPVVGAGSRRASSSSSGAQGVRNAAFRPWAHARGEPFRAVTKALSGPGDASAGRSTSSLGPGGFEGRRTPSKCSKGNGRRG